MSPSFLLPLLLQSALLPFGAALVIMVVARKFGHRESSAALAVLAGVLTSYFAIHRWSPLPQQALDWLPWTGLLILAAAVSAGRLHGVARLTLRLGAGWAVAALTLAPVFSSFETARLLVLVAVSGVLLAAAWTALASESALPSVSALVLVIVAGGAGLALMIDASQSLGQLHGALAMTCAACLLVSLITRTTAFGQAAAGTSVALLAALLLNAHVYAGFSLLYLAPLLAGLAGALVPVLFRTCGRTSGGWIVEGAAALAAGIPVLIALALVLQAAQESGGY